MERILVRVPLLQAPLQKQSNNKQSKRRIKLIPCRVCTHTTLKIAITAFERLKSTPRFILVQDKINNLVLISCARNPEPKLVSAKQQ